MNTGNAKNVLTIIIVAILSSVVTLLGYNTMNKNNGISFGNKSAKTESSAKMGEIADSFGQENVTLTNYTTSEGYPDFTKAAERSVNGVVHVKTKTISQQQYVNPFDFFFGFGDRSPAQPREQVGFGSGVIISKDGYIITNNHVVANATEVLVTLNDNREFTAKVVGNDPQSDIALLKIEGNDFPYLTFGNSDELKVGEWVLAVGNPFNLTSTVTAGIVSAKNRGNVMGGSNLGIQSFIQVDAAVNPGNSGGALVNTRGELVGINTAIFSQTGNFAGYAFAVPISIAGKVAADLKEYGKVQRAVLGILSPNIEAIRNEDPNRARELSQIEGVLVEDFADRSAARAAGMQKGDIIKSINGVSIRSFSELQGQLNRYRPGNTIKVTADRNGKTHEFNVELKNDEGNTEISRPTDSMGKLGATFKEISEQRKRELGINSGIEVVAVESSGLFRKEGINKGFIIMRMNNNAVNSERDVANIIAATSNSQDKVLLVAGFYPNGRTQYIAIDLTQ